MRTPPPGIHPVRSPRHLSRRRLLQLAAAVGGGLAGGLALGGRRAARASDDGTRDVVVVGGGLSGLVAAWMMSDHDVLLLEAEDEAGGRICAGEWNGLTYSLGAAYTGKPDADMKGFYREIGVTSVPVPPPVDGMALGGVLYPDDYVGAAMGSDAAIQSYAKMANELARLEDTGIGQAVYTPDLAALRGFRKLDRFTLKRWLDAHGIDDIVQRFVDVECRGLFGVSHADFSLLFSIPELSYNFYAPGLARERMPTEPVPDFHTYAPRKALAESDTWTFATGMMEVVDAMVAQPTLAGRVETGARATRVKVNRDRSVTVHYRQGGTNRSVKAYAAVLATPAPVTAKIVESGLSDELMAALRSIRYTTYVTMALFTRERLFRNAWNIACLDTPFTTLNDAVRTQVPMDHDGESILGVAMPPADAADGSLLGMSDDALVARALKDVERYLPGAGAKVLGSDVKRFEHAFPVFGPGYERTLQALHNDPSARGPLFLAGDYTVYPTLGGAAVSGELADRRVRAYAETVE